MSCALLGALLLLPISAPELVPTYEPRLFQEPNRLEWRREWSRFRTEEYVATAVLAVGTLSIQLLVQNPNANWSGGILFDDDVRESLLLRTPEAREAASDVSDVLTIFAIAYPFLFDAGLVALLGDRNPDVAMELSLMGLEAFAASTFVVVGTKRLIGRVRPGIGPCPGTTDDFSCGSAGARTSFVSGHSAAAFTAAGLTCANHAYFELYGSTLLDTGACVAMLSVATTTGALRIAADKHYLSDVLAGAAIGFLAGYAVPVLLHYADEAAGDAFSMMTVPTIDDETVGLRVVGSF